MTMDDDIPAQERAEILQIRLNRAERALQEAETALEARMRDLYQANQELSRRESDLAERLEIESRQLLRAQATAKMATIFGQKGKPFTASRAANDLLGLPQDDEPMLEKLVAALHPLDASRMMRTGLDFFRKMPPGIDHVFEHRIRRYDTREVRWLRWSIRRERATETTPAITLGTVQDFTERRADARQVQALQYRAERRVRELDKLSQELAAEQRRTEQALETRTRFITEMAHAIRTPLNSLTGGIELLSDKVHRDDADFAVVQEANEQLTSIANRLLEEADGEQRPADIAAGPSPVARGTGDGRPVEPGQKLRVLLAEDTESNRYVIEAMLGGMGCDVTSVGDGAEAVERVRREGYDLVLMDVMMPLMTGEEATQAIRALPGPASRTPIVGITAHSLQAERERLLSAGMTACLAKPIRRDALETALQTARIVGQNYQAVQARFDHELFQRAFLDLPAAYRERMRDAARKDIGQYSTAVLKAIEAKDDEQLSRAAHTLKGVSLNVGAVGIVEELTRFREAYGSRGDPSPDPLRQEIAASLLAIDDLYRALIEGNQ